MKKTFFLIACIAFTAFAMAQGNLQFNQVIRVKNTSTFYSPGTATVTTITVPTGKVWKIESASVGDDVELSVDGQIVYGSVYEENANTLVSLHTNMPMWLAPGTYTVTVASSAAVDGQLPYTAVISGLEFNVVP